MLVLPHPNAFRILTSALMQVTRYVTETPVLRDGEWVNLRSSKLVPGDLVRIRSDWLLPCDLLIIKGVSLTLHGLKYFQLVYSIYNLA